MKATAHRLGAATYTHRVAIRDHQLVVDEPEDAGGQDQGPSPQELLAASLASCTAITIEMYAKRKGWEIGAIEVAVQYTPPAQREDPTRFELELRLPADCSAEQRERLRMIAGRCPVHRTLEGEVVFEDRIVVTGGPTVPAPAWRAGAAAT
ncbi:MAG: OsmC family protein [Solirubrobacteraceae bacterium]